MGSGQSTPSHSSSGSITTVNGSDISQSDYSPLTTDKKKYGLVIGCNYTGTNNQLRGCINDANNIKNLLTQWGFDVILMTDVTPGDVYPTRGNILAKLSQSVSQLNEGDVLFVYYSGHGTLVDDQSGDELSIQYEGRLSPRDSCIVPINFNAGLIRDDEIRTILLNAKSGSKVMGFFDSCNSGSVCDLRYNYFDTSYRSNPGDKNTELVPRQAKIINNKYTDTNAQIVTISGCRDDQLSIELTNYNGYTGGALTYNLLKFITVSPVVKFGDLLYTMRNNLYNMNLLQVPSLMSGKELDTEEYFSTFLNI